MKKIKVGVFFGGRSVEHDVSIISAKNVMEMLDKNKYDIVPIGIDKNGKFFVFEKLVSSNTVVADQIFEYKNILDGVSDFLSQSASLTEILNDKKIDVAFPILHGTYGEDGCIQGLFKIFDIPFVGPNVSASAICMDKDITKRLLKEANIPCAKGITFYRHELDKIVYDDVVSFLGNPLFIKPASLGSSVGINKVKDKDCFFSAVKTAFLYDNKIIIEEFIDGKEVECSVLGNEFPEASVVGEIVVNSREFYSYDAKYIDKDGVDLNIPASISEEISEKIRSMAIKAFKIVGCEGMSRIDFFVKNNNDIFLNEINTIPGFTEISMYPKLWEASGIPYSKLLDRVIDLAIDRHLKTKHTCIAPP
jgi:D-alanine-D-alanine ligase